MYKTNYQFYLRFISVLILLFGLFGLSYANQKLPKHYPQQFDLDGYIHNVDIAKQNIQINGYTYGMSLQTVAYGLNGEKISLLSLASKTKIGVVMSPYVKGQKRTVSKIWILPSSYELEWKPL